MRNTREFSCSTASVAWFCYCVTPPSDSSPATTSWSPSSNPPEVHKFSPLSHTCSVLLWPLTCRGSTTLGWGGDAPHARCPALVSLFAAYNLPTSSSAEQRMCFEVISDIRCCVTKSHMFFQAGDERVNEQPGLTMMQRNEVAAMNMIYQWTYWFINVMRILYLISSTSIVNLFYYYD